ncbi:uncharacterized protein LOC131665699 [Phymastichus coffea]|uniref:uncharacterized protein LOC131665699 n=1 Tax=Phymastichus coffea TaxID=108790 RepID=UPI00273AF43D|nr:uncharacterized protein LOC131665699 [Phymastichus coffea]
MTEKSRSSAIKKFLRQLKEKGKVFADFRTCLVTLEEEAASKGLSDSTIKTMVDILQRNDLSATNAVPFIKCMIPKGKVNDNEAKKLIVWFLRTSAAVTTLTTLLQWIIGCWEYQLVNRNSIYIFYDAFFYLMVTQDKLEAKLAQLIYLITKPEDVTRRQVLRLIKLNGNYRKPPRHLTALLSLFKSYKPEFVPEKIPTINIQGIWKPIPEFLRLGFEDARDRIILIQTQRSNELYYNWNIFNIQKVKKNQDPLVPSVGYFNLGSNIFNEKIEKSIFDITTTVQLGNHQSSIRMPCNSTSLLSNIIGYHLLTYTDFEYQQRFVHNLYNTFWRSFIFENGRYSNEEMNKILDMTIEFSKYMQHGIPIVSYFVNEYMSCYVDDHQLKLLGLMQWSSISLPELQDYVLKHIKLVFYSSSIQNKCMIIRTLRTLMLNLFVINNNLFKNKSFPFLGQNFIGNIPESVRIIESFTKELIVSSLNIHSENASLVSEALSFYEQIDILEIYKETPISLPPIALVYSCFINKSCALLSRICALLLQYRKYFQHKNQTSIISRKWLVTFAEDFVSALWFDNCFSTRLEVRRYFLKSLSEVIVKSNGTCDIDSLLNICQHYAVLPYLYTLSTSGLHIQSKHDARNVAAYYYKHIHNFITALLGDEE